MTEKEWRAAHKDRLKEYYRKYREKQKNVCTMDCFKCPFPDCRNSAPPTKAEKQMIRDAFGVDDPIQIKRKQQKQREYNRIYSKLYYEAKKKEASA
ncbi:hypothetical protein [Ruminococcus sp.]|uniref:hypothetical protein n=1 Tax=Ruminococcus sp. TaxID=41978 RepID=UPI001B3E43EA|nr:hypothetical protein [Ruminococcus sp.]MBP5431573.1 hypothetical protein [Ruminococcus sp.]